MIASREYDFTKVSCGVSEGSVGSDGSCVTSGVY